MQVVKKGVRKSFGAHLAKRIFVRSAMRKAVITVMREAYGIHNGKTDNLSVLNKPLIL